MYGLQTHRMNVTQASIILTNWAVKWSRNELILFLFLYKQSIGIERRQFFGTVYRQGNYFFS